MANFLSVFHHDFKMLLTRRLIPLLCITLMITSMFMPWFSVFAENDAALDLDRVDSFLIAQVKAHRIPGLAVAIVQNDQIIFMEGYGNAAPGKPVTPQTQFYIGSVTKSFTALAAMQLVEQGKLELDSPVQEYLPWFQVADPEASAEITVRHLLNHTSGLSEIGDPDPSAYTSSLDEQARKLKRVQLTAPIGSQYKYYNQNYRLVGLLIEVVSGQSYKRYLQDHIFASMGMSHSTADPATASELAQGYSRVFGFPLSRSQKFVPGALPSGYLISTAEDMSKYLLALLNNQLSDGSQLLQPELLETMRTPPPGIDSEYGMGWLVTDNDSTLIHGGALEYFQSFACISHIHS